MTVILAHLGESIPPYLKDCVHQLRLWNFEMPIYCILDRVQDGRDFWTHLEAEYGLQLIYTDTLKPTPQHQQFRNTFKGDEAFRKGFWKHVKERFFYVEELIIQEGLSQVYMMEYDVLVYGSLADLTKRLATSHQTLRLVMDNQTRGHPGFVYIPRVEAFTKFTVFLSVVSTLNMSLEDMQTIAVFIMNNKSDVHFLPAITEWRNRSIPNRTSRIGNKADGYPHFLSEDSEALGCLFDSAVVGQWVGGIDSRNTNGMKISRFENEGALYSIREMSFEWRRDSGSSKLWRPYLDGRPLMTIHCHSKALSCFLSDRESMPTDDYDVAEVHKTLLPN